MPGRSCKTHRNPYNYFENKLLRRNGKPAHSFLNAAVCIMVIFPARTGAYASMANLQKEGGDFVEEYYAKHLGDDYADELFNS